MGFFGGLGNSASSSASTQIDARQEDNRVVADGGSSVSSFGFSPTIRNSGKGSDFNFNVMVEETDHGAIAAAFDFGHDALSFGGKAIESNTAVSMQSQQLARDAIAAANASAAREAAAARAAADAQARAAQQAAAAATNAANSVAAGAQQSLSQSLSFARGSMGEVMDFATRANALNNDGFESVLTFAADLFDDQKAALTASQQMTAQAFETAQTTAQGALDQKTITVIVLSLAGVAVAFALRRRGG